MRARARMRISAPDGRLAETGALGERRGAFTETRARNPVPIRLPPVKETRARAKRIVRLDGHPGPSSGKAAQRR